MHDTVNIRNIFVNKSLTTTERQYKRTKYNGRNTIRYQSYSQAIFIVLVTSHDTVYRRRAVPQAYRSPEFIVLVFTYFVYRRKITRNDV